MVQRLTFVLDGRDDLSRTLNNAGNSAARLHRRLDDSMRANTAAVGGFTRDANGRLRDLNGRFAAAGGAARGFGNGLPVVSSRLGEVASSGSDAATAMGSKGGGLGPALGGVAAVAGLSLLPALGALVPMLAGAGLAAGTLKLGFAGVGGALEASGKGSKEYEKALKKLPAPAREFTRSLVGLKKEFKGVGADVQKAMLPGFTKAVKGAGPLVKILGRNMVDLGGTFGKIGAKAGRVFKDSGFQKDLQANLTLGKRFIGDMMSGFGGLGRSLMSFGASSGPTLRSLSTGLRDLLGGSGKGLPGMFDGLKRGIGGSAKFLDGLFGAVNKILPALGRLSGETAKALGPLLGELLTSAGDRAAAAMDVIGGALRALSPLFKDLTYGMKIVNTVSRLIGGALKDTAVALVDAFAPAGKSISKTAGPLQRLHGVVQRNKGSFLEFGRVAGVAFLELVSLITQGVGPVIGIFKLFAESIMGAFGGIVHGAAIAFGWVPGLGDKLKAADSKFQGFKDSVVGGLEKAQRKANQFSKEVVPRLKAGQLKLSVKNWEAQLKEAKRQLKDPNLTKERRAKLKADARDLEKKIRKGKKDLASLKAGPPRQLKASNMVGGAVRAAKSSIGSVKGGPPRMLRASNMVNSAVRAAKSAIGSVKGKTVRITAVMNRIGSWSPFRDGGLVAGFAGGGPVRGFPGGGPVRGPGTGTSDSILARLSNNEFVIKAKSVAKYGLRFLSQLNEGKLGFAMPGAQGTAGAGAAVGQGLAEGLRGSASLVQAAAARMASSVVTGIKGELQIASPSKRTRALAKDVGSGLIKGMTGSRSQIQATAKDLAKDIWSAFTGRKDNYYVAYVNRQTKKILDAAKKRDTIAATIKRATEFAETTRVGAKQAAGLGGMFESEEEVSASGINSKLQQRLAKMKTFTSYIKTLAKRGLNKTMLREILTMGPEEGYAYASALAGSSSKLLKEINSTQYKVNDQAESLGRNGADALYDAGKNASKGFLTGLKSQQKALESYMVKVAKGMQKALRRALGIRSPSRVMAEDGRFTMDGFLGGLDERMPALRRAMGAVADEVAATRPALGRPAVSPGTGGGAAHVQIDVHGALDPVAVGREIQKALLQLKRAHGVNINLGVG